MLPQMSGFVRIFDKSKNMNFLIKNKLLLKKYSKIGDKVSNTMKKTTDSEPKNIGNGKMRIM